MSVITIRMKPDGSYILDPPVVIITPGDQSITWNLAGNNWNWLGTSGATQGIICDTNAGTPYTPWPSVATGPTYNGAPNQFTASANSVNSGTTWIFYKWRFSVINSVTGTIISVDPDIGNQPEGGTMDGGVGG